MTGTAIGSAFDFLVGGLIARMATVDPRAVVADTITGAYPMTGAPVVCVGSDFPTSTHAGEGDRTYEEIGGQGVQEDFTIPCYSAAATVKNDMKAARDAAIGGYDALCALVASDVTLGGSLLDGRWAAVGPLLITAPLINAEKGTPSRWFVLSTSVHCLNHYYPAQ